MEIYKVIERITEHKRGGIFNEIVRKEEVIISNLETAQWVFDEYKNDAECYTQYSKYSALVQLFKPVILSNGKLAYHGEKNSRV